MGEEGSCHHVELTNRMIPFVQDATAALSGSGSFALVDDNVRFSYSLPNTSALFLTKLCVTSSAQSVNVKVMLTDGGQRKRKVRVETVPFCILKHVKRPCHCVYTLQFWR